MKLNFLSAKFNLTALLFATLLYSCSTDNCVKCEKQLPNSVVTQELCEDGANVSVTINLIGIVSDSIVANTSVTEYQAVLTGQGYSCK